MSRRFGGRETENWAVGGGWKILVFSGFGCKFGDGGGDYYYAFRSIWRGAEVKMRGGLVLE